jgi:hypothetical protein
MFGFEACATAASNEDINNNNNNNNNICSECFCAYLIEDDHNGQIICAGCGLVLEQLLCVGPHRLYHTGYTYGPEPRRPSLQYQRKYHSNELLAAWMDRGPLVPKQTLQDFYRAAIASVQSVYLTRDQVEEILRSLKLERYRDRWIQFKKFYQLGPREDDVRFFDRTTEQIALDKFKGTMACQYNVNFERWWKKELKKDEELMDIEAVPLSNNDRDELFDLPLPDIHLIYFIKTIFALCSNTFDELKARSDKNIVRQTKRKNFIHYHHIYQQAIIWYGGRDLFDRLKIDQVFPLLKTSAARVKNFIMFTEIAFVRGWKVNILPGLVNDPIHYDSFLVLRHCKPAKIVDACRGKMEWSISNDVA